jgi:hypothetical protein
MPKGLRRYYGAGDLHFITCSCYKRKPWLDTGERRDLFLNILEEVRKEHRFVVLGYVVMPEHFHFADERAAGGDAIDGDAECETAVCAAGRAEAQAASSSGHPPLVNCARSGAPKVKSGADLAGALLRFQCLDRAQTDRKFTLYALESRKTLVG